MLVYYVLFLSMHQKKVNRLEYHGIIFSFSLGNNSQLTPIVKRQYLSMTQPGS